MTAFAADMPETCPMTILGQRPILVEGSTGMTNAEGEVYSRTYQVIIDGNTELNGLDIKLDDGWRAASDIYNTTYKYDENFKCHLSDSTLGEADQIYAYYGYTDSDDYVYRAAIWVSCLPKGKSADVLGADAKYVIYPNRNTSEKTTETDKGDWASNDKGWWIQFGDGSYLTNAWWQSPYSGLWYYMGADGYMVTNTVIDGYTINADGAWVQ